jgi:putative membrane-bound dehydrogenase-like protein
MGHHNETMEQTLYLDLVTRGMLWTLDKLDEKHFRRVSPEEDAEAQKNLGPKGKVPTPINQPAAGKTGGKMVKVPNNLALGKPTSASSTQPGRDHRFAVDGQFGTRWCAANANAGYWWQVDLGKAEKVTGCRIVWEFDGRRYRYKVEGSADGEQWTTLVDATQTEVRDQVQSHKFDADGIRFVRITSTELDQGSWMSFWEFEVHGTEVVEVAATAASAVPNLQRAGADGLLSQVKAPDGFKVTLFAAPPDINYPACIAAAPSGELFVGVDENGSLGKDPTRNQRIVRCKDTDGDGVADEFKIFADKVGSVRGMFFDNNTMWVLHPPLLRVFHDDDGDGVADRNEVLVEGLGSPALQQRGADHCTNGIQMGIDGWIYIAVGDFGFTKAVGKDGRELQLHGGGIARVRPDGTNLEIYARGLRNIYDVAIDPYMNLFTRDNTNDGGGWDIRLSHIIPSGNYGYPSLFKNFEDEIVQPLAVLGGGSGTGALYVSEPGLPAGYGDTLYTCDWGRNAVYMHTVTPSGAGFTADQQDFVQLPRPTDIDVDGEGRIYIASWNNGEFAYKRPDVGYVLQLTPAETTSSTAFPDLTKATDDELIQHLASPSHTYRLHTQREVLRRGSAALFGRVAQLARDNSDLAVRAAAIFTLAQSRNANLDGKLLEDDAVQEFAVRALGDRQAKTALADVDFTAKQPRVRLQAVAAIGRAGAMQQADALVQATADADPLVVHAAINSLVNLRAVDACFRALDSGSVEVARGAACVLQQLHEPRVVDGLIARLQRAKSAEVRLAIFRALCRLYHREADWDGNWWSTRPDTTGPYFKFATWDESKKIGEVLKYTLASAPDAEAKGYLVELNRHQIKLGDSSPQLFKLAGQDPTLRATALALLQQQRELPSEAKPLVEETAADKNAEPALRAQALSILARYADDGASLGKLLGIFAEIDAAGSDAEPLLLARDQFIYDLRRGANIEFFASQLAAENPQQRELAAMVLLAVAGSPRIIDSAREQAAAAVNKAWDAPDLAPTLLRATGRTLSRQYADRVASSLNSSAESVRDAARFAADLLRLDDAGRAADRKAIKDLEHAAVVDQIASAAGDVNLGRHLFLRQGCIACHTVSPLDTPRGPQLTDIGRRYKRTELAESILKPSAKIAQGFDTQWFETSKGLVIDGFITRESGDQVEVRTLEATDKVIPTEEIVERGKREISAMPEGLVNDLTPSELASLLAYLEALKSE